MLVIPISVLVLRSYVTDGIKPPTINHVGLGSGRWELCEMSLARISIPIIRGLLPLSHGGLCACIEAVCKCSDGVEENSQVVLDRPPLSRSRVVTDESHHGIPRGSWVSSIQVITVGREQSGSSE